MDFDQIETFLEVAKLSSFSRAAERRFRTQPAISSQIRSLEEEVGAKLLDRSGGRVAVTAAGKVFQKYAEETIEQRRVMLIALAEMHRIPRGEIVVSANEGTCLHILPEVFAEFKRQYPDVAVNVKRSEHQKILEALIENSCDFGVVSMPIKDKRYTVVPIHRDELVVITPFKHPLAGRNEVSLADVAQYPFAAAEVGPHSRYAGGAVPRTPPEADYFDGTRLERIDKAICGRRRGHQLHFAIQCRRGTQGQNAVGPQNRGRRLAARSGAGVPQRQSPEPRRPCLHRDRGEAEDGRSRDQRRAHLLTFESHCGSTVNFSLTFRSLGESVC